MEVREIVMADTSRRRSHKDIGNLSGRSGRHAEGRECSPDEGANVGESQSRRHLAHSLSLPETAS